MILSVVPDPTAARVLHAVAECRGVQDPKHPIRAVQLDIEAVAACLCEADGTPLDVVKPQDQPRKR